MITNIRENAGDSRLTGKACPFALASDVGGTDAVADILANDGLIAAIATRYGLHVMTRNTVDFEPTGVMLINPWINA